MSIVPVQRVVSCLRRTAQEREHIRSKGLARCSGLLSTYLLQEIGILRKISIRADNPSHATYPNLTNIRM